MWGVTHYELEHTENDAKLQQSRMMDSHWLILSFRDSIICCMYGSFVGRARELGDLNWLLEQVRNPTSDRPAKAVALRGRRRVGKSRLVTEFVHRAKLPSFYFVAEGGRPAIERQNFMSAIAASTLPQASSWVPTQSPETWSATLSQLTPFIPNNSPSIIVIDEVSYLTSNDDGFEGALQSIWDRTWSKLPLLLVLIGSNRSEMERLTSHGRPFYGRAVDKEIKPLNPADVKQMTGLDAANAIDAYLVTGGLPTLVTSWPKGQNVAEYLVENLKSSLSPLVITGERVLSSEYPVEVQAKDVLRAIGSDARTFTAIGNHSKINQPGTLVRCLEQLVERGIVAIDEPLSTAASRHKMYRVDDPFMRFWLAFLFDAAQFIDAGRGEIINKRLKTGWNAWRGKAVEPVIRNLLLEKSLDGLIPMSAEIGSWWNRTGTVEVDLVGADRKTPAHQISFIGSIKWRESQDFNQHDLLALIKARASVPGANDDTPLFAVSRNGGKHEGITILTPAQLF